MRWFHVNHGELFTSGAKLVSSCLQSSFSPEMLYANEQTAQKNQSAAGNEEPTKGSLHPIHAELSPDSRR